MTAQTCFADIFDLLRNEPAVDYRKASRMLREIEMPADLRVAMMGNMTLDLLIPCLRVAAASVGQVAEFQAAPFGQHMQHLHDEALASFRPDILLLALSPDVMRPDGFARFQAMTVEERQALRDGIIAEIEEWMAAAISRTAATLMIANFPSPRSAGGLADLASEYGEQEFYLDLNHALIRTVRGQPRALILDVAAAAARVGTRQAIDARLQHLAKLSWTQPMIREVGQAFAHAVVGSRGLARKCLVLDLDNTLWGGVVGEDGPHGVHIGPGDMVGEAFHSFQLRVRALKERGILLALCSKNNPADVEEIFRERGDMPLKLSDMAATAVGWQPKHEGLEQIARTLNIGLDALVFLDDNPAEIAAVRAHLPQVQSVLLPAEPAYYVDALDELPWFEKGRLTAEDSGKAEQYAIAVRRDALKVERDPEDYLRLLEMRAVIREADSADLLRLHQLFAKTNQFNLTAKRLGLGEIEALLQDDAHQVGVAELRDKFGNLGTVALYVLRRNGHVLTIDHLMMSCRAMGRGLEDALMNDIKQRFLAMDDVPLIQGLYVPTPKNSVVSGFYEQQGFERAPQTGCLAYRLGRTDVRLKPCNMIKVENE
ncbi:HAD-IIIC family phosphatase [Sphingobium bisphenolivorans]|uniref:HAD-IIIC family phosphatase n=1 Tax=Sphingobium bisphenolivorans TaxID=1335760 RepID=UPI0003A685C0|nr:HAD-IIIC family phosphatase [Sphingobium bisphenolivorans]